MKAVLGNPIAWLIGAALLGLLWVGIKPLVISRNCVLEGTLIDTPTGPVKVELICEGDEVTTRGTQGQAEAGRVSGVDSAQTQTWLNVVVDDRSLRITAWHPISTPRGWIEAGELRVGDFVDTRDGPRPIRAIAAQDGRARVFDLEVTPQRNYFAEGVLVHNKTIPWRKAACHMKTLVSAQADFKTNDRDQNGVEDYWVADVAGLYRLLVEGHGIRLIESSLARADRDPRPESAAADYEWMEPFHPFVLYAFQALRTFEDESGKTQKYDVGSGRNRMKYGFLAVPEPYSEHNRYTILVTEAGILYRQDLKGVVIETTPWNPVGRGWERLP